MKQCDAIVISNKKVAFNVYEMILEGDFGLTEDFAGQFVQVQVPESSAYLRRPFSITDYRNGQLVLVYRIEGRGTLALRGCKPKDTLNVLSPLGHPFPIHPNQKVALIGGGIGVVPLYGLNKRLVEMGCQVHSYLGYQDAASVIYKDEFEALSDLTITTLDGSVGQKGNVLDSVDVSDIDVIYACGPHGLLKAIQETYPDKTVYLSLEARMACGFGVCNACVCRKQTDTEETFLICKDGPVFNGKDVIL
ncbi:hypothetical protein AOC36_07765 [Erysipelothrix larvae]|uniref:FAD-binding FR-type domain-containing protein n=1 Tax=Erysipelothrix larvae TaxID=1514105 RepID=A0A109UH90_9FIRM|nr:dihydroorotate dehydrogenase electron transfer subunit [Erysipelothrix larvae]AMC93883.1 hypothetical protein AOC36_07765 [Erysipelothrix larvae]